ncbi:MAG: hypothetical protein VCB25_11335 [Myxococcota bacterium]
MQRTRIQKFLRTTALLFLPMLPIVLTGTGCGTATPLSINAQPTASHPESEANRIAAEAFIDAFYSWDARALSARMDAPKDAARTLYYQGWAEAGNYQIQNRRTCEKGLDGRLECAITVTDDIGTALGYIATDVFHLTITAGRIVGIEFDSDDPLIFAEVFEWMAADRPEVFEGPCENLFNGGETPGECVRAVVRAARDYVIRTGDQS